MPKIITPDNHDDWLNLRVSDLTSTEASALFGLSPYMTEFELHHQKVTNSRGDFKDNERMKWGRRLEDVIAKGVAEDLGITVRRLKTYMRHSDEPRMGSSFDYEIVSHEDGPGLMEIKNVDSLVYRDKWEEDEAPAHIEVQVQHQMEVADKNWCLIVGLIGGNTPIIIHRKRDRDVGAGLRKKIKQFWANVDAKNAPEPDFSRDADFINTLYNARGDEFIDATDNDLIAEMLGEYKHLTFEAKSYDDLKKSKKAEILMFVNANLRRIFNEDNTPDVTGKTKIGCDDGFSMSIGMTKTSAPTIITKEMVGDSYGGRQGFLNFRVNKKKVK